MKKKDIKKVEEALKEASAVIRARQEKIANTQRKLISKAIHEAARRGSLIGKIDNYYVDKFQKKVILEADKAGWMLCDSKKHRCVVVKPKNGKYRDALSQMYKKA